jgi:hypothetical protein
MTGYQKYHFSQEENVTNVENVLGKGNILFFLTKRLTGALDSYKEKRQVSMLASLRKFKTVFDSKRMVIFNNKETLHDTKPYETIEEAFYGRTLLNSLKQGIYSEQFKYYIPMVSSKNCTTETLKYFLRMVLNHYNNELNEYQVYDLIELIPDFSADLIINYLTSIMIDKGVILNKMHKFRSNGIFIKKLYENIFKGEIKLLQNTKFINEFKDKFSDFI